MALWPAKKEPDEDRVKIEDHVKIEVPDLPQSAGDEAAGGSDAPDALEQLCARLDQLGGMLQQANQQVLAYLIDRESQTSTATAGQRPGAALEAKIDALAGRLGRLEAALKSPGQPPSGGVVQGASAAVPAEFYDGVNHQLAALAEAVQQLQERLDAEDQGSQDRSESQLPDDLDAPVSEPVIGPAIGPPPGDDWQRALLGDELAEHPGLGFQRQRLFAGVLEGDPGACALLGQLLVFRSARTDKMPPLLKDIGESYYRWQPKNRPGADPMEQALVAWLKETMQDAGIANTIELVEPGERFDSTRHNASTRGVEITEVRGWIVLRDNGKVYTKANVVVR